MQAKSTNPHPVVQPIHGDPWFDDGNLVLAAGNTQFRIYRGIICASSAVFKGMFELPQLVSGDEVVDGCPIVQLSDSAEDLHHVLKAIFDRGYGTDDPSSSFPMISAFLRLGKKYEINRLYDEAMKVLRKICPTTLKDLEDLEGEPNPALYVQVVNLALETATFSLLPTALSISLFLSPLSKIASGFSTDTDTYVMRHEGLTMCCLGRDRLNVSAWRTFQPSCGTQLCNTSKLNARITCELDTETVCTLVPWGRILEGGFCSHCVGHAKKCWNDWRKKVWSELPSYYGLPSWEELLAS